jgi:hypothetical protein
MALIEHTGAFFSLQGQMMQMRNGRVDTGEVEVALQTQPSGSLIAM